MFLHSFEFQNCLFCSFFSCCLLVNVCFFLKYRTEDGRKDQAERWHGWGVTFYFSIWKKKKTPHTHTQRSDVDRRRRVLVALSQISMYLMSTFRSPEVGSVIRLTETGRETPTQLRKAPWGIYLFDWMKREAADTAVGLSPAITEPSFCCCFAVGSALMPLSFAVHLRTTKLTNVLNICSQSAIIILYTCEKSS